MEQVIQWGKNPDFAEVAEALNVRTDQIMLTVSMPSPLRPMLGAIYTPNDQDRTEVWKAVLQIDDESILRVSGQPTIIPGAWEEIEAIMKHEE